MTELHWNHSFANRPVRVTPSMKALLAETLGTFALVFIGTGIIVLGASLTVISLTWALTVTALILLLGKTSGAHLNPAVTLGLWSAGRFPARHITPYLISQSTGALGASLILHVLCPTHAGLGGTEPSVALALAFGLEILMTALLMGAALTFSGTRGALVIGTFVGFAALIGGPLTGTSLNPARSLGPALISGRLTHLWLYVAAPTLGALLAARACTVVRGKPCCA